MTKISKRDLDTMLQKAIEQVKDLGITFKKPIIPKVRTYKAKSYFGQCRYRQGQDAYEITISEYHLANGYDAVMETMVHEVLHVGKGSRGHDKTWKKYVAMVNREYGYNISRCGSSDNGYTLAVAEKSINYIIQCTGCNQTINRTKKSKLITHTENYRCGRCRSKLKRIK